MEAATSREERWRTEAEYFNRIASSLQVHPLEAGVRERYDPRRARTFFDKEFRFQLLRDLRGKKVLDVGCGDGSNSILLAHHGARVVGIDISEQSIAIARRRAELEGVADRVQFECGPIELARFPESHFDVVWGDGVLHHVIPELELVLSKVVQWAKPAGTMIFSEPVSLHPKVRQLRLMLPIPVNGSKNERPLERAELERIQQSFVAPHVKGFSLLMRANRWLFNSVSYERARPLHRAFADGLAKLDETILSLQPLSGLAGMFVIWGSPRKSAAKP